MRTNNFYERLIKLAKQRGQSINYIERKLGYGRNSLHNYKNGSEPSAVRLIELSHFFGTSPEYLLGMEEKYDVKKYVELFHKLSDEEKLNVLELCHEWELEKMRHMIFETI